jgi:hypothetical protein
MIYNKKKKEKLSVLWQKRISVRHTNNGLFLSDHVYEIA